MLGCFKSFDFLEMVLVKIAEFIIIGKHMKGYNYIK